MAGDGQVICANRDCRVAETGRCVEGLELTLCPHYGHEPTNEEHPSPPDDTENDIAGVRLPGADTLTLDEASRLLRRNGGRVIAVIGPKGAGKTSLIASLYDLFQEGAVATVEYARSETLHAFELTCHDARAASRRSEPDIERTPLGEVRFYHLDVAGGSAGNGLTLLLGDRAGEEYRLATDNVSGATPFPEVIRADTVTVLVDGQRLVDAGARHNLRSEIILMLQALLDGGALSGRQRLVMVLTKLDAVRASPHEERAQADFASLQRHVISVFRDAFARIETCKVAASPKTGPLPRGTGVAEVLEFWAAEAVRPVARCLPPQPSLRAFSRLTAPELFEADGA
jgi:energy-coupling factor transporter ATP-binding protein EcfA2